MATFDKISVVKEASIYFDGKVTSRTLLFENGDRKTLGIMLPGEYEFKTGQKEIMEILSGQLDIQLFATNEWTTYTEGQAFEVPGNSSFKVLVKEIVDYCCSYITE